MVQTRSSHCPKKTITDPKEKSINHPFPTVKSSSGNLKPLIEEANYFTAIVKMLSSFQVIREIENKLTLRQVRLFRKTCFGQFLKLRPLHFSGQLVHQILLRQLVCPKEENSLWFAINGKKCEFGLKEFALITGLDCSEYVSSDFFELEGKLSSRIRDKYFDGSDKVSVLDVARVFRDYQGNSDKDAVKLAQLYLLEAFLLSKQRAHGCHNLFIRLVDNADEFNKFPWGRYVYDFTVKSMKDAIKSQIKKLGEKRKDNWLSSHYEKAYIVKGFPHALQFWAYECMPLIGEKFGERIYEKMPRMLNWDHAMRPVGVFKNKVFGGDEFQVENGLQPTKKELQRAYFRYFLMKQKVRKWIRTAISNEDNSLEEHLGETTSKGKDSEESENGDEFHMNEARGDNDGRKYNYTTRRKARKECGDDRNSEPQPLRKMIREAFCELRDEIIPILKKQRSNVAETDFDEQPNFEKLKYKVFNGVKFQVAKQRVKKRKMISITQEDESRKEQAEETVMKGQDYENSDNGYEIHMNEEGLGNGRKRCNVRTLRKARIEGENYSNSELLTWRKTFREEFNTAKSALIDEIRAIVIIEPNKQQSTVADIDFDEDDNQDDCTPKRKHRRCNAQGPDEIPCFTVDLFEHPNHDEKAEFDEWIKLGLQTNSNFCNVETSSRRNMYFDVYNELHPGFDFTVLTCNKKYWFFTLNGAALWLSSSHIDVALYFIRKKKENHPDAFKRSCTTTDSLFYSKLNRRYLKFKQDPENFLWVKEPLIQKTVEGLEPQSSLPWVDVDTVYIPVNVNKKHWVVGELHLKERRLNVYDSYNAAKHDKEVVSACHPIAEMVPWLLKSVGFFDERNDIHSAKYMTAPFDVNLVQDVPQQENEGDSGMFMLKFTEFLMQDVPLEKCNWEAISFFRNKMAVELYSYGKKRTAKK